MPILHIILGILLVITLLVCMPVFASFITVPIFLARKAFGAFESEVAETAIEEEA